MVHSQVPASVPREPSHTSPVVNRNSIQSENTFPQRDLQSSAGSTSSLAASQETVRADNIRKSKKGRSKKPKSVYRNEVTSGMNREAWSWETQTASFHQQFAEFTNRSANNNIDRFGLLCCKAFGNFCHILCIFLVFSSATLQKQLASTYVSVCQDSVQ